MSRATAVAKASHRKTRAARRERRRVRIRKKIYGTQQRPRLSVFRSNKHITAQVIDDETGRTLAAASTVEKSLRSDQTSNAQAAAKVGTLVAQRAQSVGVETVILDRGGNRYHGRVAALAQAAREAGLKF